MAEPSLTQQIAGSSLMAGLPPEFVEFLASRAKARHLAANEVLFHTGEKARSFYLITNGRIAVEVAAIEGPSLPLQDLSAGSMLGWSWLIPPSRWAFQARATQATDLIEFDGDAVLAECESNPRFGYQLLKRFASLMSERLQQARQRMVEEWRPAGFA
jgi:CRP-like cAMP-binding protein